MYRDSPSITAVVEPPLLIVRAELPSSLVLDHDVQITADVRLFQQFTLHTAVDTAHHDHHHHDVNMMLPIQAIAATPSAPRPTGAAEGGALLHYVCNDSEHPKPFQGRQQYTWQPASSHYHDVDSLVMRFGAHCITR
jgi:hypothetical protein